MDANEGGASKMNSSQLIEKLSQSLSPVKQPEGTAKTFMRWAVLASVIVVIEFLLTGGFRANALDQLRASPRFLFETVIATLMTYTSGFAAIALRIPDDERPAWYRFVPFFFLGLFGGSVLSGFMAPVLPESSEHQRFFCELSILGFGLIPALAMYKIIKKGAVTEPSWSASLLVLASLGLPATLMQIGCAYSAYHVFTFHVLPLGVSAVIGMRLIGEKIKNL